MKAQDLERLRGVSFSGEYLFVLCITRRQNRGRSAGAQIVKEVKAMPVPWQAN